MKKILAVSLLVITLLVLIVSSIDDLTRVIAQARYKSTNWWGSDKYNYGDLYGFCYLPQFRIKDAKGVENFGRYNSDAVKKNIDLYALTDSYTWSLLEEPALFRHVNRINFAVSNERQIIPARLDKSKKNVLLLECTERNVRDLFKDTAYLQKFLDFNANAEPVMETNAPGKVAEKIHLKFKLKDVDPNIEFNTWDYHFLTPFKELKAQLNYKLFNRVSHDVYLSPDEKYLLYGLTIDTIYTQSSFKPLGNIEVSNLITALNNAYQYYKSKGFDEVYLSIIPNPVSILYPHYNGAYNQLITRLQDNKALKCGVIDAYSAFKKSDQQLFCTSDTHWNYAGEKLWVELMNEELGKVK